MMHLTITSGPPLHFQMDENYSKLVPSGQFVRSLHEAYQIFISDTVVSQPLRSIFTINFSWNILNKNLFLVRYSQQIHWDNTTLPVVIHHGYQSLSSSIFISSNKSIWYHKMWKYSYNSAVNLVWTTLGGKLNWDWLFWGLDPQYIIMIFGEISIEKVQFLSWF